MSAAAALVPAWIFVAGLGDGTVGPNNLLLWMTKLGCIAGALYGSRRLRKHGRAGLAWLLLSALLVPAFIVLLFIVILLLNPQHWKITPFVELRLFEDRYAFFVAYISQVWQ
jgi:hypothetical protein